MATLFVTNSSSHHPPTPTRFKDLFQPVQPTSSFKMAQVIFTTNNITIFLDSTVASVDLGFAQAYSLSNNDTESVAPLSGTATSLTVTYVNNIPEPVTYNLTQGVSFTPNAPVTIKGN